MTEQLTPTPLNNIPPIPPPFYGILFSHEEEGNSAMFDSMDEPEGCHAK